MESYRVKWERVVQADSAKDAALHALNQLREPDNVQSFIVQQRDGSSTLIQV